MNNYSLLKRVFDWFCVAAAVPVFGLPALLIAIWIKLDDRGPVFFTQTRVGHRGRPFLIYKFRSMRAGQVTRAGRLLRATGLDELPQWINIFLGDMSVVGPRPLTQFDVERLSWTDEAVMGRWFVRPGMTGLAQINAGCGAARSLELDLKYIRERGLKLDFEIVAVSFLMNVLGKRRTRGLLAGQIRRMG